MYVLFYMLYFFLYLFPKKVTHDYIKFILLITFFMNNKNSSQLNYTYDFYLFGN